jgi:outer membrane protein
MRKLTLLAALATATAFTSPAMAAADGKLQVKVLATGVLPDGKISKVKFDPGLPAGTQTKANDNVVPTLAVEYFFTPNVSVETICCLTQHDVDGTGPVAGAELVADAKILPATVTLKYHLDAGAIKPYIGAGPSYFVFIDEKPGAFAKGALASTKFRLNDKVGLALQAGVDIPVNDSGMAISFDAKRYFLKTDAEWFNASGATVLKTRHKIDPWVVSGGVAFRF